MNVIDLQREFKHFALVQRGLRPRTLADITRLVSSLCVFSSTSELEELNGSALRRFFEWGRTEKAWAAKTYRLYWQYLKSFFDWCIRQQYARENPLLIIERPKLPKRLPRCLSHKDAVKVMNTATSYEWYSDFEHYRNQAIIATLLMTGLRLQELIQLRREDIDVESRELFVEKGKGGKDRVLPIHPKLNRFLRLYGNMGKSLGKSSAWFFHSSRSSKPLQQRDIRNICQRLSKASGVKFTPHMLRHIFAREMLDSGLDIYKLKELLGHSSVATTQIYASVSRKKLKESVESLRIY